MVNLDSERAAELGTLALRLGPPSDVATLLIPLYRRNVRLADAFLAQVMAFEIGRGRKRAFLPHQVRIPRCKSGAT